MGGFFVVFTVVNKSFQIWMHDKISLVGSNLSKHFCIFSLGLTRSLGLLRIEILSSSTIVLYYIS
jgi:hypothetical protein